MKKLFLLVVVLAALTIFCSAAFAQYGYVIPTLETVRRAGSTVNVYTYRDANGNKIRETEYYVNDDGSYGNLDVYYGSQGLISFKVQTDYKNGVCTMTEQSTSYSADGSANVNTRETTFNPDGKVDVLTFNIRELENDATVITGMKTDGFGRKVGDFKEESYKDADNNDVVRRTVYNPDKTVNIIHTTKNPDGTKVRMESIFDENDKVLHSSYNELDKEGNEVYSEAVNYSHSEDGSVRTENFIVDRLKGTQLHYFEDWHEFGSTSTAEGELLDKDGKKLADYSFENTFSGDGSEVRVDTFIYPNGRVDIISKTVDANGKITINKQLDFKAAGEPDEEAAASELDGFYDWALIHQSDGIDEIDEETLRYFEEISDVWGENIVETGDVRGDGLNKELNEVLDNREEENSAAGGNDGETSEVPGEANGEAGGNDGEISDVSGEANGEAGGDNGEISDVSGEANGESGGDDGETDDVPVEANGAVSEDNGGNSVEVSGADGAYNGGFYDGGSYDGGSYDGGSDGGSDDGGSDGGGSDDGGSDDGGFDD